MTVRFCTRCVMSNQRPRIAFNDEGVCFACLYADHKRSGIDWQARRDSLARLCDLHRSLDGSYDCVVPGSGGKDSAFVAHKLKHEWGMHPLTVTWSPHLYTDIGRRNLDSFIASGFDNILITPNGQVHRRMTRLSTDLLGEPFQPFIYGQVIAPVRIALQHGIKLIFSGENGECEYTGNPEVWDHPGFKPGDYNRQWFSGFPVERWIEHGFSRADLAPYLPPAMEAIEAAGIERHFFGYYEKWHPQACYYYATEHTGFEANPDGRSEGTFSRYASLDDRLDGFHYWLGYLKFGIGRCTSDAAHEVRDGDLTRDEAVALVRKYDGEFPVRHFQTFLEYTGLSEEEFFAIAHKWRNDALVDEQFKARCVVC